jgi:hypothetical protein
VLICLQHGNLVSDTSRMSYSGSEFYMKSGAEMERLFPNHPEALANTVEIARRCNVELVDKKKPLHFPTYTVPPEYKSQKDYLMAIGKAGLKKLYPIDDFDHPKTDIEKRVADRFNYEVGVIEKTGFINYFLVVQDFIAYAKSQNIPVGPGRGSGAGSMLAYALGITALDPLLYNLLFERFLNPDRVSPPDFDIDFCQARRGEVIEYVKDKYGRENVAQIITFGTLGAKTVIRDIGRVLALPLNECDKLAKMVPETPGATGRAMRIQRRSRGYLQECGTVPEYPERANPARTAPRRAQADEKESYRRFPARRTTPDTIAATQQDADRYRQNDSLSSGDGVGGHADAPFEKARRGARAGARTARKRGGHRPRPESRYPNGAHSSHGMSRARQGHRQAVGRAHQNGIPTPGNCRENGLCLGVRGTQKCHTAFRRDQEV